MTALAGVAISVAVWSGLLLAPIAVRRELARICDGSRSMFAPTWTWPCRRPLLEFNSNGWLPGGCRCHLARVERPGQSR